MFKAIRLALFLFFCLVLWAAAHYEFGFYLDRAHSKGGRIYRVNSYEQFIKRKAGQTAVIWTELASVSGENLGSDRQLFS